MASVEDVAGLDVLQQGSNAIYMVLFVAATALISAGFLKAITRSVSLGPSGSPRPPRFNGHSTLPRKLPRERKPDSPARRYPRERAGTVRRLPTARP